MAKTLKQKLGLEPNELPKLVLFDLDGTLVDSALDLAQAVDATLLQLGRKAAGEQRVRQWVGNGAEKLMRRALAWSQAGSLAGDDLELKAGSISAAGIKIPLALFLDAYKSKLVEKTVLYPGVKACLDLFQQQGIKMAVVTNKPHALSLPILDALGIAEYFCLVLGGDSLEQKKPDPMPLCHAMDELNISPIETLMVGDSKTDIDAAKSALVASVGVSYGYDRSLPIQQCGADVLVDDLAEFARQLLG